MKIWCVAVAWWIWLGSIGALTAQSVPAKAAPAKAAPVEQGPPLEFTDTPQFSVAGITDWTAVGGHGSDATLRTSEELARIAAAGDAAGANSRQLRTRAEAERTAGHEAEFHRLLGEADEAAGDPLAAVHEDERAAALNPSEQNLLQWGSELLVHRAVLEAANVFADGVHRYPGSVRLRTGLGSALFAEAKYSEAAAELCRAADLRPGDRETLLVLGRVGLQTPAPEACVQQRLERWVASSPEDAEANGYAGRMLLREPDSHARGETMLRHAVELDPKLAEAWLDLGVLAAAAHHDDEAEQDLRATIAANPQLAEAHFRLAVLLRQEGHASEAKREFALHEQLRSADAARVERERAGVKEFVITEGGRAPSVNPPSAHE